MGPWLLFCSNRSKQDVSWEAQSTLLNPNGPKLAYSCVNRFYLKPEHNETIVLRYSISMRMHVNELSNENQQGFKQNKEFLCVINFSSTTA